MTVASAEVAGQTVQLTFDDGQSRALHAFALRDACACPKCRLESGQRLFESHEVLPDVRIASASLTGGTVEIAFSDGHVAWFEESQLRPELGARRSWPIILWDATLVDDLPTASYEEVVESSSARRRWLAAVSELGFALLRGAPVADGVVADVAELFSPVRTTNYGRVFDVMVKVDSANLADSELGLSLHTDNPYRVPPPTLQLLHCLASSASGGATVLADGFRAVEELRALNPSWLRVLATHPIRYRYEDAGAILEADVPVISLDVEDRPVSLQLNNRSKGTPSGSPEFVEYWYRAYFRLHELLRADGARVELALEPGDVVVFDNRRVLHGRTAFAGGGERWLQGCYADRDALSSSLALLEREVAHAGA